jgi:hypothetical protein
MRPSSGDVKGTPVSASSPSDDPVGHGRRGRTHAARVSAANSLLDRGAAGIRLEDVRLL